MWSALITIALVIAAVLFLIQIYNGLIRLKNQVDNGLAQIDVQLKRRHDLIPNLVEVAGRYMGHEAQTLTEVTQARNHAKNIVDNVQSSDSGQIGLLAQAENMLSQALGRFYAVAENYPELKANTLMKQLMDEITNTENRIGFARQHYNDSVMFFNNQREVFPNNIISSFFKFERLEQLQFEDKSQLLQPPTVSFA